MIFFSINLFTLFAISISKIIEFKFQYDQKHSLIRINGTLGTPMQNQTFGIDIGTPMSISFPHTFNSTSSNSYLSTNKEVEMINRIKGVESTDSINLVALSMKNFHFVQMPSTYNNSTIPLLGLGKGQGSFIDQLYQGGYIDHKIFHINQDSLFVGGTPSPSEKKCNLTDSERKYSCYLNSIVFSDDPILKGSVYSYKHIIVNQKASFETNVFKTSIPEYYLELFENQIFRGLFKRRQCLILNDYNYKMVYCKKSIIPSLPNIHLLFGDIDLLIKTSELWEHTTLQMDKFLIEFDFSLDEWIFGYSIIKNIPITFSEEEKHLAFVSDNVIQVEISYHYFSSISARVAFFAILVLSMGMVILILLKNAIVKKDKFGLIASGDNLVQLVSKKISTSSI